jgi:hydroxyacylglutathione hydrolase
MLFSGDILFAGDVGRIDFYGEENIPEIAALLYDSLYNKILPLGEEVILCPAHGAGSVCGSQIEDRELTTIGIEKRSNPYLQYQSKNDFVNEVGEMEAKPKYFKNIEAANLNPAVAKDIPFIPALSPKEFEKEMQKEDTVVIDIRSDSDYAASHIPGAVFLWENILSGFVGWFLENDKRILLVNNGDYPEKAAAYLFRMGYENFAGYLARGMLSWHMAAKNTDSTALITVSQLCDLLDVSAEVEYMLLDIRKEEEKEEEGYIAGALEIPLTELQADLVKYAEEIDRDGEIYIFCGSGMRSMTAASLLENQVKNKVKVVLGGLNAWSSTSCPIKIEE